MLHSHIRTGRFAATLALASVVVMAGAAPARAQATVTKETAAAVKASFSTDLETLQQKFVGLAQAFPQDKYTWRPMDGVRSVSEVLMLAAFEGYTFIPNGFGGKPASLGTQEEMGKLRTLTDKAQVVEHLNKAFAHAKKEIDAIDPATLTGTHKLFGRDLTTPQIATLIGGDLHEHLGQLIAYARMNHIVPPWSK
ncbi:MAG TPA: DinB family protein [Vicinamibacterales bacterium]|nr:DinB family protein [Vicinamibacterales bacterium]